MIRNFIMNPNENIMDTNLHIRSVQSSTPSCVLAKNFSKSDLDKSLRTDRLPSNQPTRMVGHRTDSP
jgi:hypothetical protein